MGSLYYMSPEQIQGALDLDPRADLYSLGVSLYEMVTRTRPFQGDSEYSIMAAHLNSQPVPPIQIDPTLPSGLSDIILMAIAKDANQRFQTADAFRKALESVEGQFRSAGSITKVIGGRMPSVVPPIAATPGPSVALPVPPPMAQPAASSRRGLYMAIGSLVTVAVLAVAALQGPKWFSGSAASSVPPTQQTQSQPVQTTVLPNQPAPATVAPPEPAAATLPDVKRPLAPAATPDRTTRSVAQNTPVMQAAPVQSQPVQTQAAQTQVMQTPAPPVTQPKPAEPAVDTAKVNALRELREHMVMLASRANSARATLSRMKEQQARQGLGMRGDILSTEQRMENYLDDAQAALGAGDPDRAKKALSTAEREIDKLDSFLGR